MNYTGKSSDLEEYRAVVKSRLHALTAAWFERFIPLSLANLPARVRETGTPYRTGENVEDALTLREALDRFPNELVAILGEPGAGKTTLLQQQALIALDSGTSLPIFVELANYNSRNGLVDLMAAELQASGISREESDRYLEEGGFLVFLDGLNEVDEDDLLGLAREIIRVFRLQRSKNRFVVTCRTSEWPPTIDSNCRRFELLSITPSDAEIYLASVLSVPLTVAASVIDRFDWGIRQLTYTPLLLHMLAVVLAELEPGGDAEAYWTSNEWTRSLPRTRSALYERFTRGLLIRDLQDGRTRLPIQLHEWAIMYLARHMANNTLVLDAFDAGKQLERFCKGIHIDLYTSQKVEDVVRQTLHTPPLISSRGSAGPFSKIVFMHQSFQEYYTALDIAHRLGDEASEKVTLDDLKPYTNDPRWWDTFTLLGGLLEDSTDLCTMLIEGDQLHLAARCMYESQDVSPIVVDRIILLGYERFKYEEEFDYRLIDLLHLLIPIFDRASSDLPKRLLTEIEWWCRVYTMGRPRVLDYMAEAQVLMSLDSVDSTLVVDAIYTCGERGIIDSCSKLVQLLMGSQEDRVREQVVIALGKLRCQEGMAPLQRIALAPNESPQIRSLALTSLSEFHEPPVVSTLVKYLLNVSNPFRESAAWALSRMDRLVDSEVLLQALQLKDSATEFSGDQFVLGTTLYAIGKLRDATVIPFLVEWAKGVDNPFVLEDLVYTLGSLGDPRALEFITAQLGSTDALVRKRAVEALAKFKHGVRVDQLVELRTDPSPFVRESAEIMIQEISSPSRENVSVEATLRSVPSGVSKEVRNIKITKRHSDLIPLIMAGLENKEIADYLNRSVKTVTNHITEIMTRLGVSKRTQIAMWGIQNGFKAFDPFADEV